jgi:hypothetical protein
MNETCEAISISKPFMRRGSLVLSDTNPQADSLAQLSQKPAIDYEILVVPM